MLSQSKRFLIFLKKYSNIRFLKKSSCKLLIDDFSKLLQIHEGNIYKTIAGFDEKEMLDF